ncbi:esterase-like activity of phytase family protein [Phenylobacterium deserti]|uniref:Phytase-like domain-containing protein n=1 Tax=Phenylobacterium deserti TaxID=1914756 RepID=A0A328AA66_9CAUL|nr:esterase-like activity of phytase family protein [Phenylobacterium deserti]RAK51540.1 hypothetical protein DJ018_16560 [Phenylobacterium deserti]
MRSLGALAALLLLAGCAQDTARLPPAPVAYGPAIEVQATPVPLNPLVPSQTGVGRFTYAGGLKLSSDQTSRLHGLSDLKAWPDGRFIAQGDQGDQLEGRLVLDQAGRLVGLTATVLRELKDGQGRQLFALGDRERDAEGIVEFANGDRLISFEQNHRILLYPGDGGPPRSAPMPDVEFELNGGMESLAPYPQAGADAYLVGEENTGRTWLCRLSTSCASHRTVQLSEDFRLVAMDALPGGAVAHLLRGWELLHVTRSIIRVVSQDGRIVDEVRLGPPLSMDNFEAIAAVPQPDGRLRFYILSDDNFSDAQRTLLLAFDWTPPAPRP